MEVKNPLTKWYGTERYGIITVHRLEINTKFSLMFCLSNPSTHGLVGRLALPNQTLDIVSLAHNGNPPTRELFRRLSYPYTTLDMVSDRQWKSTHSWIRWGGVWPLISNTGDGQSYTITTPTHGLVGRLL
jgi:hypothetical protein